VDGLRQDRILLSAFLFGFHSSRLVQHFLGLLIARAFKMNNVNPKFNGVVLMPFVAGLCDIFENTMHVYFLADLDRATPWLVALSGLATNTKWILSLSVTAMPLC